MPDMRCALRVICINYATAKGSAERERTRVAATVGAGVVAEVEAAVVAGDIAGAGAKLLCSALSLSLSLSAAIYIHFPLTDIRFPAADSLDVSFVYIFINMCWDLNLLLLLPDNFA